MPPRSPAWAPAVVSALGGALLAVVIMAVAGGFRPAPPVPVVGGSAALDGPLASLPSAPDVVTVAEQARGAVLRLEVEGAGTGSGVVFDERGHVLTNAHVIQGGHRITAVLADGEQRSASLIGADPVTDVAVLRLSGDGPFPVARLGTTLGLKVGQAAVAIGCPLGLAGGPSVTTGVISALGRRVESPGRPTLYDMIQTDAPIAPGSSGGVLLDAQGAVIGITSALVVGDRGAEGLSFAVPVDVARDVAEEILASGQAAHPWLGVTGTDLDPAAAERVGVPAGALVQEVVAGSPGAAAGLQPRDVVVQLDHVPVVGISELVVALRSVEPGHEVELIWVRDGARLSRRVTLVERPQG